MEKIILLYLYLLFLNNLIGFLNPLWLHFRCLLRFVFGDLILSLIVDSHLMDKTSVFAFVYLFLVSYFANMLILSNFYLKIVFILSVAD